MNEELKMKNDKTSASPAMFSGFASPFLILHSSFPE